MSLVLIPWYATVFRGDRFETALAEIAPVALRYGATDYALQRSQQDGYKFSQYATFEHKIDFDRYWYGEEFSNWRADYASWYQVPVVYEWFDVIVAGSLEPEPAAENGG
jgi:hypothetical protein